jgi:hypothetical protein
MVSLLDDAPLVELISLLDVTLRLECEYKRLTDLVQAVHSGSNYVLVDWHSTLYIIPRIFGWEV